MMLRRIVWLLTLVSAVSVFAQEVTDPWNSFALYGGFETQSFPPYDFGAISTFLDGAVPLSSLFDQFDLGLHFRWQMTSSMFHIQTIPIVEAFTADLAIPMILLPMFRIGPFAGTSLVINNATSSVGLSADIGLRALFEPHRVIRVSVPLRIGGYLDGISVTSGIGARVHALFIPVALKIGYTVRFMSRWDFSVSTLSHSLHVALGAEI